MDLNYRYAESTVKPAIIEINAGLVYLRKDIESITRTFEHVYEITYWVYQEAALSLDEFNAYANLLMVENAVKGVNDSANIVQIIAGQENGDTNQLTIMEAIADLYDIIASTGV